jgi:hypothetical protein
MGLTMDHLRIQVRTYPVHQVVDYIARWARLHQCLLQLIKCEVLAYVQLGVEPLEELPYLHDLAQSDWIYIRMCTIH